MRGIMWRIVAGILAIMAWGPAAAQQISVCNNGEEDLSYAVVATTSLINFGNPEWTAHGWYMMKVGECQSIAWGDGQREAFLSVRRITKEGPRLASYAIEDIPSNFSGSSLSSGAERVFCVSRAGFRRPEQSLEAHERCPQDYYRQVFNLYLYSRGLVNFTLRLE